MNKEEKFIAFLKLKYESLKADYQGVYNDENHHENNSPDENINDFHVIKKGENEDDIEEVEISSYDKAKIDRMVKYKNYKEIVKKAIDEGKTFRVISTMDITKIRLELKRRGVCRWPNLT